MLTTYERKYLEVCNTDDMGLIPSYQVMDNQVISSKFKNDTDEVYKYCIENKKNWAEVIGYKRRVDVLY